MRAPSKPWTQTDEATIRTVISVLSAEEQSAGLHQPSGIGQRPKPISSEELPVSSSWRNPNGRKTSDTDFSDDLSHLDGYYFWFIAISRFTVTVIVLTFLTESFS